MTLNILFYYSCCFFGQIDADEMPMSIQFGNEICLSAYNTFMFYPFRLQDEVVTKTQSFERLKVEAEKCLAQSERFNNEKLEFESAIYAKVCE